MQVLDFHILTCYTTAATLKGGSTRSQHADA